MLVSFFYCDEQIRCGKVTLPAGRESKPESGPWEKTLYVEAGALSVNLTGTGRSLLAGPATSSSCRRGPSTACRRSATSRCTALFARGAR